MQRGLEGRRIALFGSEGAALDTVRRELEAAGATVQSVSEKDGDEDWHGAKYAALVLIGANPAFAKSDPRLVQLVREFLVADKPLAAYGSAVRIVFEAGGVEGRSVSADGDLKTAIESVGAKCVDEDIHADAMLITARESIGVDAFAARLLAELSSRLEESAVDEMSELSFPASDPPAVSPTSIGHLKPEGRRAES
jgi:putative intracellular protease/amidase